MSIMEMPAEAPDVFGIPEYKVSTMRSEAAGPDVRLAFGDKRFGQIQWHYTVIMSPSDLLMLARQCEVIALEAINHRELMGKGGRH